MQLFTAVDEHHTVSERVAQLHAHETALTIQTSINPNISPSKSASAIRSGAAGGYNQGPYPDRQGICLATTYY